MGAEAVNEIDEAFEAGQRAGYRMGEGERNALAGANSDLRSELKAMTDERNGLLEHADRCLDGWASCELFIAELTDLIRLIRPGDESYHDRLVDRFLVLAEDEKTRRST